MRYNQLSRVSTPSSIGPPTQWVVGTGSGCTVSTSAGLTTFSRRRSKTHDVNLDVSGRGIFPTQSNMDTHVNLDVSVDGSPPTQSNMDAPTTAGYRRRARRRARKAKSKTVQFEDADIGIKVFHECAIENYCRFYGIPPGGATIMQVDHSSAGILG